MQQVAQPASGARSKRRSSLHPAAVEALDLDERRAAVRRFVKLGTAAWTAFFVTDVVAAHVYAAPLEYLAAVRFIGTGIGVLAFIVVRGAAGARTLAIVETLMIPLAAVFISLAAMPCGGMTSPLVQGVGIVTMVRAVLPSPFSRAFGSTLASALAFPAVALGYATFAPAIRAQLQGPSLWTFVQASVFLVGGAVVAAGGSHLLWNARTQVHEARRLGSYRLLTRIGAGGMGDVWLARQMPLDRPVALKIMKEGVLREEGALRRFKREALAASQLSHPHTIRVYDFGASDDGIFYIAMELLDGLDLEALIERTGPLPVARAVHIARQACSSLAEAHHAGIVHCDVKPANVFVAKMGDQYDFVKVLDFGLARLSSGPGSTTLADSLRGTPAFMPPEQVRGERVGPESDVYAMGAVLYFMLTGTTVFKGKGFHEMVMAQLEAQPQRPSIRRGEEIPHDVEAVVMRCLAKRRGDRYVTARELDAALAACASSKVWRQEDARAFWSQMRPSLGTLVTKPG